MSLVNLLFNKKWRKNKNAGEIRQIIVIKSGNKTKQKHRFEQLIETFDGIAFDDFRCYNNNKEFFLYFGKSYRS